ncbi:hypothetical protein KY284_027505 [Solanum tuberosum]|nr:hypothetical protein KY284_027505 [Solanum tuberosum]
MWNEDYGMINHPINVVENPVDDVEVKIQEAAGEGNENNLPKEPAHLQQGFIVEDCNAYSELQANNTSFVGLLTGCGDSAIRNNWELNTFSPIQEPMIPDFAYVKSNITMPEIYGTLAEMFDMGYTLLEKSQTQHQPKPQ